MNSSMAHYLQIHVSNLNGFNDELQVDICDPNNGTFYTLEVKLENEFITVMSGSSSILPTANINQSITVSIGSAPGRLMYVEGLTVNTPLEV